LSKSKMGMKRNTSIMLCMCEMGFTQVNNQDRPREELLQINLLQILIHVLKINDKSDENFRSDEARIKSLANHIKHLN